MDESDLKHALYCFISDGCSADQTFSGFCSDIGYDEDSRNAERIYKACQKSLDKFRALCPDADIYDVINELND